MSQLTLNIHVFLEINDWSLYLCRLFFLQFELSYSVWIIDVQGVIYSMMSDHCTIYSMMSDHCTIYSMMSDHCTIYSMMSDHCTIYSMMSDHCTIYYISHYIIKTKYLNKTKTPAAEYWRIKLNRRILTFMIMSQPLLCINNEHHFGI